MKKLAVLATLLAGISINSSFAGDHEDRVRNYKGFSSSQTDKNMNINKEYIKDFSGSHIKHKRH